MRKENCSSTLKSSRRVKKQASDTTEIRLDIDRVELKLTWQWAATVRVIHEIDGMKRQVIKSFLSRHSVLDWDKKR